MPPNQRRVTGFQPNISEREGSLFDLIPISCSENRARKGSPIFTIILPSPVPKSIKWEHPTLPYIPLHKNTLLGEVSMLKICPKVDVIIHQSEQVDEDLSQLILALSRRARISADSRLDTTKIDLTISLK